MSFESVSYGKWILAGEHSVLRGFPALVFPIYSHCLNMRLEDSADPLVVNFSGPYGDELKLLFWGVLEDALARVSKKREDLTGVVHFESRLPLGAGLGASAALCVALARWWNHMDWIESKDIYEFSRNLENLFHGESSGVDIAAAMSEGGLRFMRGGETVPLRINWQPCWFLSYSGQRGMTADCVKKVKQLALQSPDKAERLDQRMAMAVSTAEKALALDVDSGFSMLAESIDLAKSCFLDWSLVDPPLDQHMQDLIDQGAAAVKPTGSGGGGYVLSLWDHQPPQSLDLISL